jgi:hypothetical protein
MPPPPNLAEPCTTAAETPVPPRPVPPIPAPDIVCEHCNGTCNFVTGACGTCAPGYAKDYYLKCTKCAASFHLESGSCTAGGWLVTSRQSWAVCASGEG